MLKRKSIKLVLTMIDRIIPASSCAAKRRGFHAGLFILLALLLCPSTYGLSAVSRGFDELVQLADVVIVGTVGNVRSELTQSDLDQNIVSFVSFNKLEVVKGQVSGQDYTLQVPGGIVGRFAQDYPGVPQFRIGQRYVVFVRGNHTDLFPVVGITQGVFRVLTDAQGQRVVVRDDIATEAAQRHSLSSVTNGAVSLHNFLQQIRSRELAP